MKRTLLLALAVLAILAIPRYAAAQRGGGGRGGGGGSSEAIAPPVVLTAYENADYGVKFPLPPDMSLFTPEVPKQFRQMLGQGRIAYLTNLMGGSSTIVVRLLPKATEADLKGMKDSLEGNPPQAKYPEYKKISLANITIGSQQDQAAVEYVYTAKENDKLVTTRQVAFVHKGNGFMFICTAPAKDFEAVNKKSFDALFAKLSVY